MNLVVFLFPKSISLVNESDYCLRALKCIETSSGRKDVILAFLKNFMYQSARDILEYGDNIEELSFAFITSICVDDQEMVIQQKFEESIADILQSLEEKIQDISIIIQDEDLKGELNTLSFQKLTFNSLIDVNFVLLKELEAQLELNNNLH